MSSQSVGLRVVLFVATCSVAAASPLSTVEGKKTPPPVISGDARNVFPDPPDEPVTLEPADDAGDQGAQSFAYPTTARYIVNPANNAPWASLRNWHQLLFIGSVADGHNLDVTNSYLYSRMGYVPQRWFCGWVFAESLDNIGGSGTSPCPSTWEMYPAGFSQYVNCDYCGGGWGPVYLAHGTYLYRNVYPWVQNPPLTDQSVWRPAGTPVYWRYVSEYGNWVAVSDDSVEHLKWFFVPKTALPNICNGGAGAYPSSRYGWGMTCGP